METINISVPTSVKQFIDEQVASGAYPDAGDYIQQLVREDRQRKWRGEVDQQLLEAIDAGASPMTVQDWDDIRREVREHAAKRNGQ